jgi:ferritin-like metal-binding protein YciE
MAEPGAREAKLIQYLNEAYGKEKELETALQAHIAMTTRAPYKKRLQEHLRETKRHGREVERRIKKLGGQASGAASVVAEVATKAAATAKGPLHALRGTGEEEKMLNNAKTEYWNEHEEIATYTAIETLAQAVGDTDSAKLARDIRREEERMAKFLERQIPVLTKAVAKAEIPASERRANGGRRTSRSRSSASSSRSGSSSSRSSSTSSRSRSSSSRSGTSSSRSRSSGSGRSRSSRSTA